MPQYLIYENCGGCGWIPRTTIKAKYGALAVFRARLDHGWDSEFKAVHKGHAPVRDWEHACADAFQLLLDIRREDAVSNP